MSVSTFRGGTHWLVLLIVFASALSGCTEKEGEGDPVKIEPGFLIEVNRTKGDAPMSVKLMLVNVTGNLIEFRWDFGDDSAGSHTDPEQGVTHSYGEAGRYVAVVEAEFDGSRFIKKSIVLHVNHESEVGSSLSVSEEDGYSIPVEDAATDLWLELRYDGGQEIGGMYRNSIDVYLYYPNGTLYDTTDEQETAGRDHIKSLRVTYQYLAATGFEDWECNVKCKAGISAEYALKYRIDY